MLDAFIIEELRRRERDRKRDAERPRLELPIEEDHPHDPQRPKERPERVDSGLVVFQM